MRLFYQAFPIRDALRHELSWTHYRTLLRVEEQGARSWYMTEASTQGWSTRALDRQINTLYYERLLATSDRDAVLEEAKVTIGSLHTPREFVRDPVMLSSLVFPVSAAFSKQISNERSWTISKPSFLNSAADCVRRPAV